MGYDFIPSGKGEQPMHKDVTYEFEQYPEDKTEKDLEKHVAPAIRGHMKDFLACIETRGKPVADIEQGYISTTACILANLSMKLGRIAHVGSRQRRGGRRRRSESPAAAAVSRAVGASGSAARVDPPPARHPSCAPDIKNDHAQGKNGHCLNAPRRARSAHLHACSSRRHDIPATVGSKCRCESHTPLQCGSFCTNQSRRDHRNGTRYLRGRRAGRDGDGHQPRDQSHHRAHNVRRGCLCGRVAGPGRVPE